MNDHAYTNHTSSFDVPSLEQMLATYREFEARRKSRSKVFAYRGRASELFAALEKSGVQRTETGQPRPPGWPDTYGLYVCEFEEWTLVGEREAIAKFLDREPWIAQEVLLAAGLGLGLTEETLDRLDEYCKGMDDVGKPHHRATPGSDSPPGRHATQGAYREDGGPGCHRRQRQRPDSDA